MFIWSTFWDMMGFFWWSFVVVASIFVLIIIVIDIFRDHTLNGWWKALWLLLLVFVPLVTALVYVIVRGRGMAEREMARRTVQAPEDNDYRPQASVSSADDIAAARRLLDAGAISQGEFDALKSKALGHQYYG
jgi:Na+-translocating ferredoxin:NAD+ oxidoreductase RnfE subunit